MSKCMPVSRRPPLFSFERISFPDTMQEFNTQKYTTTNVFDSLVECQAVDSANSRFVVASHTGMVKVFSIEDSSTLLLKPASAST